MKGPVMKENKIVSIHTKHISLTQELGNHLSTISDNEASPQSRQHSLVTLGELLKECAEDPKLSDINMYKDTKNQNERLRKFIPYDMMEVWNFITRMKLKYPPQNTPSTNETKPKEPKIHIDDNKKEYSVPHVDGTTRAILARTGRTKTLPTETLYKIIMTTQWTSDEKLALLLAVSKGYKMVSK